MTNVEFIPNIALGSNITDDSKMTESDRQNKTEQQFYQRGATESHATVIQDQPYTGPGHSNQPWSKQERRPGT